MSSKIPLNNIAWKNGNLYQNVKNLEEDLKNVQIEVEASPSCKETKGKLAKILLEYNEAISDEENLLAQKAKVKWPSEGNKNTKIGNEKAPSPDGFTVVFFKKSWDIVGEDIQQPNKVSDYRPIACCNVIYKCISKIITKRIQGYLGKLVNSNQSPFVPGRIIQDNLLITQELLKGYNRKVGPQSFNEMIIGRIMTCVTSASFSLYVNRERYGYFKSGRGLMQGDHMSPYLFTLVIKVLTLIVQRRVTKSNQFKSVEVLKEGLLKFSKVFGLDPNMNKCTIFFGSVNDIEKQNILEVMPFAVRKLPMKYLGVPLITKNIGVSECNQLMERVKQKVSDWKNKALSYAGRLQLIAFVLASMHIYWASVFLIPKTNVNEIEKALKGFLWCHDELKRGAAKVAWKVICTPKIQGGLGIKRLGPLNEALMCKHLWNLIVKKDSLWVKWVNMVKLKGKSIWKSLVKSLIVVAITTGSPFYSINTIPVIRTSQSRQHVITSLIHIESCKSPTVELFEVDSGRISIITMNT
ncbi:RNA-directed DNA polymerase, eukaryota, reverse transcriptase zinc-binding domain protein [Tanacetum coccineum]